MVFKLEAFLVTLWNIYLWLSTINEVTQCLVVVDPCMTTIVNIIWDEKMTNAYCVNAANRLWIYSFRVAISIEQLAIFIPSRTSGRYTTATCTPAGRLYATGAMLSFFCQSSRCGYQWAKAAEGPHIRVERSRKEGERIGKRQAFIEIWLRLCRVCV